MTRISKHLLDELEFEAFDDRNLRTLHKMVKEAGQYRLYMYVYIYICIETRKIKLYIFSCPWAKESLMGQGAVSFEEMRIREGYEVNFTNSPRLRLTLLLQE